MTPVINVSKLTPVIADYHSTRSNRAQSARQRAKIDELEPEDYFPANWVG